MPSKVIKSKHLCLFYRDKDAVDDGDGDDNDDNTADNRNSYFQWGFDVMLVTIHDTLILFINHLEIYFTLCSFYNSRM